MTAGVMTEREWSILQMINIIIFINLYIHHWLTVRHKVWWFDLRLCERDSTYLNWISRYSFPSSTPKAYPLELFSVVAATARTYTQTPHEYLHHMHWTLIAGVEQFTDGQHLSRCMETTAGISTVVTTNAAWCVCVCLRYLLCSFHSYFSPLFYMFAGRPNGFVEPSQKIGIHENRRCCCFCCKNSNTFTYIIHTCARIHDDIDLAI